MKMSKKSKLTVGIILALIVILPVILYNFLLSQFAFRTFWFPMVKNKTGIQIEAKTCAVSLFGQQTCSIRNLTCKGEGIDLSLDSLSLQMSPFRFLFENSLEISELKAAQLNVKYTKTVPEKNIAKPADGKPQIKTTEPEKKGKPFRCSIKLLTVSNSSLELNDSGNRVLVRNFDFRMTDLQPRLRAELFFNGLVEMSGNLTLKQTPFKTVLKLKLPESSFSPETAFLSLDIEKMLLSSKTFTLPELSTKVLLNFQRKPNGCEIQDASLQISGKDYVLLDLNAQGELLRGKDSAKTHLNLTSETIDAKRIQDLLTAFKQDKTAARPTPQTAPASSVPPKAVEPEPLDLSACNGTLHLNLKKIQYTNDLLATVKGPIAVQGNSIRVDNLKITANGAPVDLKFAIDTGVSGGYPYNGSLIMSKMVLPPLLKAFQGGKDSKITGTIQSVNLKFTGKGFTPPVWKKNLNGSVTASVRNLSFPVMSEETLVSMRVLLLPVRILPAVMNSLNLKNWSAELKTLSTNISNVLTGKENMNLNQGTIDIAAADGTVNLKKVLFEGGTLKSESIKGTFNLLGEELKLNAEVDTGVFVVPMSIGGTLSRPLPDYRKFLKSFAKDNLKSLLKPENLDKTIKNADRIIDLFRKK